MIEKIDFEKCTGCGVCAEVCPLDTLRIDPFQKEVPPCQAACPAMVDIRGYSYFLRNRMPWEAPAVLSEFLPYPAITGRLCHHPCEGSCARREVDEAVNIHSLERYVGDRMLKKGADRQSRIHAGKVAVAGAGPAGLAAAFFLISMGYGVTVFEKEETVGGSLRGEVGKNRQPLDILEKQIQYIGDMGVEYKTRIMVGQEFTISDFKDDLYKALLLTTGPGSKAPQGLAAGEEGMVTIDPVTHETKVRGVFACGGMVKDRMPIVKVIAMVKEAVISMDHFMRRQAGPSDKIKERRLVEKLPGQGIGVMKRQEIDEDPSASFSGDQAHREAGRCMTCGGKASIAHPEDCMTCFECDLRCPSGAITVHPFKEVIPCPIEYPAGGDDHV
ncbi:MAG: 4Fe-4S binding protein [Pseudomonadota bacterium]